MRVAGLGMRAGVGAGSLAAALGAVEAAGGRADLIATIAERATEPALVALAQARGLRIAVTPVAGVATISDSPRVRARFATGSVAEAAALVAAGQDARLTVRRLATPDGQATAAMAEGEG
ncbi:MAG: cobalamin biosynthesis protein [Rubellimicrobium sp.]|nr:cobalamin biosynthesis protein [Rubellimicrobium sp.]